MREDFFLAPFSRRRPRCGVGIADLVQDGLGGANGLEKVGRNGGEAHDLVSRKVQAGAALSASPCPFVPQTFAFCRCKNFLYENSSQRKYFILSSRFTAC